MDAAILYAQRPHGFTRRLSLAAKLPGPYNDGDPILLLLPGPVTTDWPSAPLAPRSVMMPVSLHPLTTADFAAVDPLLTAAYARSSSMLDDLARYVQSQPDGWFLARLDGTPAGMGGAIAYGAMARIGLMAVHPDFQRRGIGRAIMEHLLEWVAVRGATTVLLDATPAGVPLYTRLGFVTDDYARAYLCSHPATLARPQADAVKPLQPADLPEVVAFDAERFGASRAAILAQYAEECAGRAFVARDRRGRVAGYLIAQSHRLGPWLADTAQAADSLLSQALPLCSADVQTLVPECNRAAATVLERVGFSPGRRWHSMRLGGVSDLQRRRWLYGYANFYFG
jgi:GNAT superfamily N-acetyltransferase